MNKLHRIVSHFCISGVVDVVEPLGTGLINDTYKVITRGEDNENYVLQRINHSVFKDVNLLQENVVNVTEHIRKKLQERGETDIDRKTLRFIPAKDGKMYYFEEDEYWRVSVLIPNAKTFETVNPEFAYYTGKAFGDFQSMLVDIPYKLGETIPDFHNMEFRLDTFIKAIAQNKAARLTEVQWMVDELLSRASEMCKAEKLHREGKLPKRITHCDTKVNNMLFDENGKVLCVIDLDTTMPGYVLSDFGDFIRTGANTGAEDDENLDNVSINMDIFRAFAKGYIESAKSFLLPVEIENLPFGAKLLTYMQTVRFLTDYIDGDIYYKIKYPTHNWVRSQAQFRLLQSIETHEAEMSDYITKLISE
ncbi:phosphotransferase enzyme family protein [Coprobacter tertius]|uniref:Aminoglycoside phosphotransferase family protein n=1 Tax=Coprobacter tertius TaxID=2944915 RepID=A0ABT1MIR1_9BACT|nr:aminoglycoside phosphotransferase family protein [Coprobacter tertius]MCP9612512.1 aminoglycoside phosphotransferase family protein [Coprobacter tertius]